MRLNPWLTLGLLAMAGGAAAQQSKVNDAPLTEKWAPTEWGADDKAGSVNRITPQSVLKAVGLVKQGKSVTLGKVYAQDAPGFGSRGWRRRFRACRPADLSARSR